MGVIRDVVRVAEVADRAARDVTRTARTANYVAVGQARAAERRQQAETAMCAARGTVALPSQIMPKPPAQPIDGAWLLNLTDAWIGKHCYLTEAARHAVAMWVTAQHFRAPGECRTMVWDKFGHLLFVAERPGSGKTTTMKVAGALCAPFYFGIDNNPTAPGLCMTISQEHAVVCVDEAHRLIGPKGTRKADVITIFCASFEQDGTYLNGRGGKANRVPVYSPMMIAGKKDPLLTSAGEEIADVIDRSVLIFTEKPPEGTELEPVTVQTKAQGALIAAKIAQWAAQEMAGREKFAAAMKTAREAAAGIGLVGRAADVWLGMFTVAALASPGHLQAACEAALDLRLNRPVTREDDDDPLNDLEAMLAGETGLPSWGGTSGAPAQEDEPRKIVTDPGIWDEDDQL